MGWDEDSPLSPKRDMSLDRIRVRYRKANEMSIVTTSPIVFESLCDLPYMIARIEALEKQLGDKINGNK